MKSQTEISRNVWGDFPDKITHDYIADLTYPLNGHIMVQKEIFSLRPTQ